MCDQTKEQLHPVKQHEKCHVLWLSCLGYAWMMNFLILLCCIKRNVAILGTCCDNNLNYNTNASMTVVPKKNGVSFNLISNGKLSVINGSYDQNHVIKGPRVKRPQKGIRLHMGNRNGALLSCEDSNLPSWLLCSTQLSTSVCVCVCLKGVMTKVQSADRGD